MALCTVLAGLAFAASLIAVASAASPSVNVGSANNAALAEQVTVSAQGRTLYSLTPETSSHLLCKSSECMHFWPPLTVPSRTTRLKAAAGVHGHLGILRRSNGVLQVTLRGKPLYRYSGDKAKGQAKGQGLESFGGTWHAVTASTPPTPAPVSQPSPPSYGY
jgi:predicted lipoprotein with Yx(FWY)xxD motif